MKKIVEEVRERLLAVPGVEKIDLFGVQEEKIYVELSSRQPGLLRRLGRAGDPVRSGATTRCCRRARSDAGAEPRLRARRQRASTAWRRSAPSRSRRTASCSRSATSPMSARLRRSQGRDHALPRPRRDRPRHRHGQGPQRADAGPGARGRRWSGSRPTCPPASRSARWRTRHRWSTARSASSSNRWSRRWRSSWWSASSRSAGAPAWSWRWPCRWSWP